MPEPGLSESDGQVFDSADNGRTWQKSGVLPAADLFIYNAAIDPSNRDHIVVGTMSVGAFGRHDGIPSLAFNRPDPTVLYLGLAEER